MAKHRSKKSTSGKRNIKASKNNYERLKKYILTKYSQFVPKTEYSFAAYLMSDFYKYICDFHPSLFPGQSAITAIRQWVEVPDFHMFPFDVLMGFYNNREYCGAFSDSWISSVKKLFLEDAFETATYNAGIFGEKWLASSTRDKIELKGAHKESALAKELLELKKKSYEDYEEYIKRRPELAHYDAHGRMLEDRNVLEHIAGIRARTDAGEPKYAVDTDGELELDESGFPILEKSKITKKIIKKTKKSIVDEIFEGTDVYDVKGYYSAEDTLKIGKMINDKKKAGETLSEEEEKMQKKMGEFLTKKTGLVFA